MEREAVINRCTDDGRLLKSVELDIKLGLSLLKPDNQSPVNYYSALISEVKIFWMVSLIVLLSKITSGK